MSSKGKAKRDRIRQETELLNKKRHEIMEATEIPDLLAKVPLFSHYQKGELNATIKSYNKIPEELELWAFGLIEKNMKAIYEKTWGWDSETKEAELYHEDSRFFIAFLGGIPIGFIHFRFELDLASTGSFVYDIHIEEELRRKGLGRFLLQAVEMLTLKLGFDMVKVALFKENLEGRQFFRTMKYIQHKDSPIMADPEGDHEYDHEVLYKPLSKPAQK